MDSSFTALYLMNLVEFALIISLPQHHCKWALSLKVFSELKKKFKLLKSHIAGKKERLEERLNFAFVEQKAPLHPWNAEVSDFNTHYKTGLLNYCVLTDALTLQKSQLHTECEVLNSATMSASHSDWCL